MAFEFGGFLKEKNLWQNHIDLVRERGGHVPTFVHQAISNGGIDPFAKEFTNLKRRHVKFRGRFYENFEDLARADLKNSTSIYEHKEEVLAEVDRLASRGGIRFISKQEAFSTGSIINPIQWHRSHRSDGKVKCRFIIHGKVNPYYSRPKFSMAEISDEVHIIAKFDKLVVNDNEDAFYQVKVTSSASKWLRFKLDFEGEPIRYAEMLVLGMGLSSSPYCVQSLNRLLIEAYTFTYNVYAEVFIDDSWSSTKPGVPHFDAFCQPLGIKFKSSKKRIGSQLVILGVSIDLVKKTATLTQEKASILSLEAGRMMAKDFITPQSLSAFLGRAEFCSKITTLGRVFSAELVKIYGQYAADGGDVTSEEEVIEVTDQARVELGWWKKVKVLGDVSFQSRPAFRS